MGQGHILTYTLKVHNLGELNLTNLANLIQSPPKIDTHGISGVFWWTEYLSETLLRPTGNFFDRQKRQKRAGVFWFGVIFIHFCLQYFMLIYFLRIIQYFLMKFCTVILGMILVVNTLKQSPQAAVGNFGVFCGPILAYVLIFIDICSIFCHEILFRCS